MPPFDLRPRTPRDPAIDEIIRRATKKSDEPDPPGRIRCPKCDWTPDPASRWFCLSAGEPEHFKGGCGTAWNTFETKGVCPGCQHVWTWTACLHCGQWSLHEQWYEEPQ
jgi:hypothetical protein